MAGASTAVSAATFAGGVVSYDRGGGDATWSNPAAAVGSPDGVSGENSNATNYFGFPNVLSPFSGAYQGDEIVEVGEGGQLTLRLARYAVVGAGKRLGVFTNVSLQDASYPSGQNFSPAKAFSAGSAEVRVSADGVNFVSLGTVRFDAPNLYYVNAGPYDAAPPASPQLTDFGKPFAGTLASLGGKDWAGTLDVFKATGGGYSGGGTWLDLSATGLLQVGYVQFVVADDGDPLTKSKIDIDAVSVANGAVGAELPEPAGLAVCGVVAVVCGGRRRGRRR
jgi:hypothetical protein